ncbi:hypothetical protein IFT48_04360 [Pseudomonas fluorescens]|uniref:hypothetical protein n=1 Tax=Pseudomonas TaxID=286 RepID=UPI000F03E2D0|nr:MULTISPECIES: hypothetical protein [Pseudomonas]MBD8089205.1 hypothetical protein [Pseudomonas fluorescens]MBD8615368.1 hypothetical protein [Pseudomonas putida]MBD8681978.1 hypothetical protein [Pseudomonas sp. CFBP 13719]
MTSLLTNWLTTPHKYIRYCEGSIRVKIARKSKYLYKHFGIRDHGSYDRALKAAISWRDEQHLKEFGYPVSDKIIQVSSRRDAQEKINPSTGEILPALPPGLSYGYHRKSLLYIVVSFQREGKSDKRRFAIREDGIEMAIEKAKEFRLATLQG